MDITIEHAIRRLVRELTNDPQYKEAWKSNIAMAFKDNWVWEAKDKLDPVDPEFIHKVSNKAAEYFLDQLAQ